MSSARCRRKLVETERRVEVLSDDVEAIRRSRDSVFWAPPIGWIKDRIGNLQQTLEHRTARSAHVLRGLLGQIRLEPVSPHMGRPFYRAITSLDALALIETRSGQEGRGGRFEYFGRWTRTQRIRTRGDHAVEAAIVEHAELPAH